MVARARRKWLHNASRLHFFVVVFGKGCGNLSPFTMRALHAFFLLSLAAQASSAADFEIQSLDRDGRVTWSGANTAGVVTVQAKGSLLGPWPARATNYFTSNVVGSALVSLTPTQTYLRLLSVDISTNSPNHYT